MAYRTIRTITRPSADIPFYKHEQSIINYIDTTYVTTGKRISNNITLSEDKLEQVVTSIWIDDATFKEFRADQRVAQLKASVKAHNLQHGIITTWDKTEI
jgi:hypothetical protein